MFGKLFGRKNNNDGGGEGEQKAWKAQLGGNLEMYFNKELKCWVKPGEEEAKKKELEKTFAPPPMMGTGFAANANNNINSPAELGNKYNNNNNSFNAAAPKSEEPRSALDMMMAPPT